MTAEQYLKDTISALHMQVAVLVQERDDLKSQLNELNKEKENTDA